MIEKQRPQDVTMDEARDMVRHALLESGIHSAEIDRIMEQYYPYSFSC